MLLEYQKAIIAVLRLDAALSGFVHEITDRKRPVAPGDRGFPYISISTEMIQRDTDTMNGFTAVTRFHTWSRSGSAKETMQIQGRLYTLLHNQPVSVSGGNLVLMKREKTFWDNDPDGITVHGVCEYRALLCLTP